mmetsp:Transcript_10619/g.17871  ORF Transcript_10619/g.17871 Transcript_10619/m.17871 type:complete len:221 (-) Transcript_10619:115-777(-)
MKIMLVYLFVLGLFAVCMAKEDFFHQRPDQHKSYPGWQEPGLWRPRWIMDREFEATETSEASRDRLYFKMKSDRTVEFSNRRTRPWLQLRKSASKRATRSGGDIDMMDRDAELERYERFQNELYNAQGTWSFVDETPRPTGKVTIETREGSKIERVRHEGRCEWGNLDGYAAKFRRGKIYKYKGEQSGSGIPLGKYAAGTFTMRANIHRPLVAKDFISFQ